LELTNYLFRQLNPNRVSLQLQASTQTHSRRTAYITSHWKDTDTKC